MFETRTHYSDTHCSVFTPTMLHNDTTLTMEDVSAHGMAYGMAIIKRHCLGLYTMRPDDDGLTRHILVEMLAGNDKQLVHWKRS